MILAQSDGFPAHRLIHLDCFKLLEKRLPVCLSNGIRLTDEHFHPSDSRDSHLRVGRRFGQGGRVTRQQIYNDVGIK